MEAKKKKFSKNNHGQNICDKLYFSCEIVLYMKNSIPVFREIFASTDKILILGGGLSIIQYFYECWIFSLYFLIS